MIDHVNTNDLKLEVILFVLKSLITDHYITICCAKKIENCPKNIKKSFFNRDKNNLNNEKFTLDLQSNLINYFKHLSFLTINNFNDTFNGFSSFIQETISMHMPLKKISRRQEKLKQKPRITKQILVDIRKRRSIFLYSNRYLCRKIIQKKENFEDSRTN